MNFKVAKHLYLQENDIASYRKCPFCFPIGQAPIGKTSFTLMLFSSAITSKRFICSRKFKRIAALSALTLLNHQYLYT